MYFTIIIRVCSPIFKEANFQFQGKNVKVQQGTRPTAKNGPIKKKAKTATEHAQTKSNATEHAQTKSNIDKPTTSTTSVSVQ